MYKRQVIGAGNESGATTSGSIISGNDNIIADDLTAMIFMSADVNHTGASSNSVITGNSHTLNDINNSSISGSSLNLTSLFSSQVTGDDHTFDQLRWSTIGGSGVTGHDLGGSGTRNSVTFGRNFTFGAGLNEDQALVAGSGATAGDPSSTRTIQLESLTGDAKFAGTLSTSFVFAGFGECAIGEIDVGEMVVFEGMTGVRLAKEGERPDGVTVKKLALCAGGGYDPENTPWKLGEDGVYLVEEREIEEEYEDKPAEYSGGKIVKPAAMKKRMIKSKGLVPNPDFDVEKHENLGTSFVEMLGRNFANYSGDIEVGDYIGAGGKAVDASVGFRVLEVYENKVGILVK